MTLIIKNTWCPRCQHPTIIREERIVLAGGLWPKQMIIIYRCTDCRYESLMPVKLNKRMAKRIRERQNKALDYLVKEAQKDGEYD